MGIAEGPAGRQMPLCVCVRVCLRYLVVTGEANIKLLSMSTNGCGPGGSFGAYTITLSMVQPYLWGTSPPPGGFAGTGA